MKMSKTTIEKAKIKISKWEKQLSEVIDKRNKSETKKQRKKLNLYGIRLYSKIRMYNKFILWKVVK